MCTILVRVIQLLREKQSFDLKYTGDNVMPDWNDVLEEISTSNRKDALDFIRRKYLKQLHEMTGRNVIAYYSGWLQKPGINTVSINDDDKNGLMAVIHGLDRSKGLDLILHTPGGDIAAT